MYADAGILQFLLRFYVEGDRIFQCDAIWMKSEIEIQWDPWHLTASKTSNRGKGRAQLKLQDRLQFPGEIHGCGHPMRHMLERI